MAGILGTRWLCLANVQRRETGGWSVSEALGQGLGSSRFASSVWRRPHWPQRVGLVERGPHSSLDQPFGGSGPPGTTVPTKKIPSGLPPHPTPRHPSQAWLSGTDSRPSPLPLQELSSLQGEGPFATFGAATLGSLVRPSLWTWHLWAVRWPVGQPLCQGQRAGRKSSSQEIVCA